MLSSYLMIKRIPIILVVLIFPWLVSAEKIAIVDTGFNLESPVFSKANVQLYYLKKGARECKGANQIDYLGEIYCLIEGGKGRHPLGHGAKVLSAAIEYDAGSSNIEYLAIDLIELSDHQEFETSAELAYVGVALAREICASVSVHAYYWGEYNMFSGSLIQTESFFLRDLFDQGHTFVFAVPNDGRNISAYRTSEIQAVMDSGHKVWPSFSTQEERVLFVGAFDAESGFVTQDYPGSDPLVFQRYVSLREGVEVVDNGGETEIAIGTSMLAPKMAVFVSQVYEKCQPEHAKAWELVLENIKLNTEKGDPFFYGLGRFQESSPQINCNAF